MQVSLTENIAMSKCCMDTNRVAKCACRLAIINRDSLQARRSLFEFGWVHTFNKCDINVFSLTKFCMDTNNVAKCAYRLAIINLDYLQARGTLFEFGWAHTFTNSIQ